MKYIEKISENSDIDSIVFSGGGIESAAAVVWAKEKVLTPLVVSISINNNDAVKQMSIAASGQAKYFGFPHYEYVNSVPMAKQNANVTDTGLDVTVRLILGNPQWNIKYIITGTNAEDSFQQRIQTRQLQRILLARWTGQYELSGIKMEKMRRLPIWAFPLEFLSKAEIFGMVASSYPKLLERVWTCHTPINNKPCLKCSKCIEYRTAKETAKRAMKRVQEGESYGAAVQGKTVE